MTLLWTLLHTAFATTYGSIYSIEEMTDLSHDVISGTILSLTPKMDNGVIKTEVTVQIEHNFVGNKSKQFTFDVLGGSLDGITMTVPGTPVFTEKQSVLLFLDHEKVVGFGQGAYALGLDGQEGIATRKLDGVQIADEDTPVQNTLSLHLDLPDEMAARSCLEVKVWDDYNEDWTMRAVEVDHLANEEFKSYPITLLEGMHYEFLSCTDQKTDAIQMTLYSIDGEELATVYEEGREATLMYENKHTQTVLLSLQVGIDNQNVKQVGTSLGVLYK